MKPFVLLAAWFALVALMSLALSAAEPVASAPRSAAADAADPFRRDRLIAWCIVPFDARQRGPEERAAMLIRLGLRHFAYDYRAEHVPTFEAEIAACRKHGISLDAWWFPTTLNDEARHILDVCRRAGIRPQLWVTGGGGPTKDAEEQRRRVAEEAARIRPIAEAAAAQGMQVGLYNHGGWFGEPENQLAILDALQMPNVGLVYNLHHGHAHVDRFAELLDKMRPHLLALNLNGMAPQGDQRGQKILPLGQGALDLELLRTIRASGYRGPIGILGHTQDDAEARLLDNLEGLEWLLGQLDGQPAGPPPRPRTPVPGPQPPQAAKPAQATSGWLVAGRPEYRAPPLTVDLRATLAPRGPYHILVASDTKASGRHWELFAQAGSGHLAAYLPGHTPDHVRSTFDVADGRPHHVGLVWEANRVRLFADGQQVAEAAVERGERPALDGGLAIGRLVEGGLGSQGTIDYLRLRRGAWPLDTQPKPAEPPAADEHTIGLWRPAQATAAEVADHSPLRNPARRAAAAAVERPAVVPGPGPQVQPVDPRLRAVLVDRSPADVYLGVKVDAAGSVFVGGRERVFVFDPRPDGSLGPRRELLRFPPDSIIMGLEFRGDELYVLTDNALYVVPEGRVRREGLAPRRLLWGLPLDLHVSFHCLAWGPEGWLYLTHGDPLLQYGDWTRPDHWGHWTLYSRGVTASSAADMGEADATAAAGHGWRRTPYTGAGSVLRYDPESGAVEVVARGLRGPVGLAFDDRGRLFTNDNDHESRAGQYAPARLLHVVEGIDFGWPRGWMASKSPDRCDLVEPLADLGRGVPCDLLHYAGGPLADVCGGQLLLARWDRLAVTGQRPTPRGSTLTAREEVVLAGNDYCRPVGLATDPRGRLWVTCLYMTGNMAAPECVSDLVLITRADDPEPGKTSLAAASPPSTPRLPPAEGLRLPITPADAESDDDYRRQLGVAALASARSIEELAGQCQAAEEPARLAAVLALGHRLTVPPPDFTPPDNLPLFYPEGNAFFRREQRFHGVAEAVDLAALGRVGSFTIAEWWRAHAATPDEQRAFDALRAALDDSSDRVALQAAYFLSLLNDARSETQVAATRRRVEWGRLSRAAQYPWRQAWSLGQFPDADDPELRQPLGPEQGVIDLTATVAGRAWQPLALDAPPRDNLASDDEGPRSMLLYARIQSGAAQRAIVTLDRPTPARAWLRGQPLGPPDDAPDPAQAAWVVNLDPGSNDLLLRLQARGGEGLPHVAVRAAQPVELALPDKLDGAELAARLRDAASTPAGGGVPEAFLAVDWSTAAASGDAAEGRRLFGRLGCAKCHAVSPDQQVVGGPSLFEARRRLAVMHLVESILLPSRQVAEPFRAQTVVTDDGRVWTGLVLAETADTLELLLADGSRPSLAKPSIEEREPTRLSPMPQGIVRTPDELRHLLAYLLSDRPLPP